MCTGNSRTRRSAQRDSTEYIGQSKMVAGEEGQEYVGGTSSRTGTEAPRKGEEVWRLKWEGGVDSAEEESKGDGAGPRGSP